MKKWLFGAVAGLTLLAVANAQTLSPAVAITAGAIATALGYTPGTVSSVTCNGTAITTTGTCSVIGQVPGIATNTAATAGNVGEDISSTVTAVSLTSNTNTNITSVSLTPGDWNCWGNVRNIPAGTTTTSSISIGINSTSVTFPASPLYSTFNVAVAAGVNQSMPAPINKFLLASTTTVYLVVNVIFATSTDTADAQIECRRMR